MTNPARKTLLGTGLALALAAAALFGPQPQLEACRFYNQKGNVETRELVAQQYRHFESIFALPASLGLIGPISAGLVNSVESFTITISNGSATGTATVSSVSTLLSTLQHNGENTSNTGTTSGINDKAFLTQTNATTITATRNGTSGTLTVRGTVIEWKSSAVNSVQMGTISITTTNTSNTATITGVTTNRSAVLWLGCSASIAGAYPSVMTVVNLTNSTTVTASRDTGTSATVITAFCVLEFKAGILNSNTQESTPNWSSSNTFAEATITAVTTAQVWLAFGGANSAQASWNGGIQVLVFLKDSTTVRAESNVSSVRGRAVVTVIEFKAANIQSVQRGHTSEIKDGTNAYLDVTISAVVTAKAFPVWLGSTQTTGSAASADRTLASVRITTTTNLRLDRGALSATLGQTPSWEVIELK